MPSLRELQLGVMRAVLDDEADLAAPLIASRGIAARTTLGIYANTVRCNFNESLIAGFPVIRRLVGEDYFRQVAHGFHARHPSLSGDLQFAGAMFAQYLAQAHVADDYRYLGEVARLEWLIQETLLAGDHAPFDLEKLQSAAAATYDQLAFRLHPSVRLFASEFPCVAIWEANVGDAEPPVLDLGTGPDRALLIRDRGQLVFHRLSSGELKFLEALCAEEPFEAAIARGASAGDGCAAEAGGHGFDAAAALRRFVLAGVIVDFH